MGKFATIIMAAGKGTRMNDPSKAKVMFEVNGKPMIEHVVELARSLGSERIVAVVGFQRDSVIEHLQSVYPQIEIAMQEPQLGTGHAVMQAEPLLRTYTGDVLVLSGDVPILRKSTIEKLIDQHWDNNAVGTILTAELEEPAGYGRILRSKIGYVLGIIEHKDATEEQQKVKEINSGIYLFDNKYLFTALQHISPHNAQNEYYLTDVFGYFYKKKLVVSALMTDDYNEIRGVNTLEQLQEAEEALKARTK
ncbi:MAG: NTP transferase domain-containing protein [Bacteroidetes bacterium]|nr:NTP transferase domain-containing protein [Bacteroidota bacterium]